MAVWLPTEDRELTEVYATATHPVAAARAALPHRTAVAISIRACKLGISDHRRARRSVQTIQEEVGPATGAGLRHPPGHPYGYVRPIMCPDCKEVFTIPADPSVGV